MGSPNQAPKRFRRFSIESQEEVSIDGVSDHSLNLSLEGLEKSRDDDCQSDVGLQMQELIDISEGNIQNSSSDNIDVTSEFGSDKEKDDINCTIEIPSDNFLDLPSVHDEQSVDHNLSESSFLDKSVDHNLSEISFHDTDGGDRTERQEIPNNFNDSAGSLDVDKVLNFIEKETVGATYYCSQYSTPMKITASIKHFECPPDMSPVLKHIDGSESESSTSDSDNTKSESSDESGSEDEIVATAEDLVYINQSADYSLNDIECDDDEESPVAKAYKLNNVKIHDYTDRSVNQGILDIMDLYLQNKESKRGLQRVVKTIVNLLPEDHNLPTQSTKLLSYVESLAPTSASVHYYCAVCLYYHGLIPEGLCVICKEETSFKHFYYFDIGATIKYDFENRHLSSILDEVSTNEDPLLLRNVRDGTVFKTLNSSRAKYDVNMIVNGDGVRIRKGSPKELWIIMGTIAELPIHLQKYFISILGVWYDDKKPEMRTFLKPYSDQMAFLHTAGVEWTHPDTKEVHKSSIKHLVCVCDAPARSIIQNCMYFNGRYGCPLCEIKTKRSHPAPNKKRIRVYYYKDNLTLRTKERMLSQAAQVTEGKSVKGVKGPSVLSIIPSADVSQCMVPEYMHSCLLGVVKQMLCIWTSKPGQWSIKSRISEIDTLLRACRHPDFVHRGQRQLQSLKYWKASDFYYFLLFESLPCLKDHLPDVYFQHFLLLVRGLFILLKSSIKGTEVTEADILLRIFVNEIEGLYGERELTYNTHQLCHLALCVQRYGPLFCWSAFSFEDMNGIIAKTTHGTNFVDTEIVNNIRICQGIHILRSIVENAENSKRNSLECKFQLLGGVVEENICLEELVMLQDPNPKIFQRAQVGHNLFTSSLYKKLQSENFYVRFLDNDGMMKYGAIKYFCKTNCDTYVMIQLFHVDHTKVFCHQPTMKCIDHLLPVSVSKKVVAVKLSAFVESAVKVGKIHDYIYFRPNLYHCVM